MRKKLYNTLAGVYVLFWLDLFWISVAVISDGFIESYIPLYVLCMWFLVTRCRAMCNIEDALIKYEEQE